MHGEGNDALQASDIRALSTAILSITLATERITYECLNVAPPVGSAALALFKSSDGQGGEGPFMDAFLVMQSANLSGCDHARALVALLRTPSVRSTALATVTRGALESFARSWYLLQYS